MDASMTVQRNCNRLVEFIKLIESCAVALSGGVDSAVVCKAAKIALNEQALAVTANSPSVAASELAAAKKVAQTVGIRHEIINTQEFDNPEYIENNSDRCFHCKTELYSQVQKRLTDWNLDRILNGANVDDLGDHRPGMKAAKHLQVISPLLECQLGKSDIRAMAKHWDLPVHDKPASPCLSSRVAYGEEVTPARMQMIEQAESFLAECGFSNFRVRYHSGDLARVEIPENTIEKMLTDEIREAIAGKLRSIGFRFVTLDMQGFRSGNLNQLLTLDVAAQ